MDDTLTRKGALQFVLAGLALLVSACTTAPAGKLSGREYAAVEARLSRDIGILASDEYGGRRPGTPGEALTLDYIQTQLETAGLVSGTNDPANPWRAPVTLVSTRPLDGRLEIAIGRKRIAIAPKDIFAPVKERRSLVEGAEIVALSGLDPDTTLPDIGGKAVILFDNGFSARQALGEMGTAAIIVPLGDTSLETMKLSRRGGETLSLLGEDPQPLTLYVSESALEEAFGSERWAAIRQAADEEGARPVEIGASISIEAGSQRREVRSANVIGRLPGSMPGSGAILLLAHWDHFGECGNDGDADRLCNGAVDNASGVAMMLELARRLAASGPYDRDIYVVATTAEEWGLLGAKAFLENPPVPLDTIVAAFNFDTVAVAPRGTAVAYIGEGRTDLDPVILETMQQYDRVLGSRITAEQFLQRQDGWALLQRDVPAVVLSSALGDDSVLKSFMTERYHRANDQADELELGGAIEDLVLHEALIRKLASTSTYPSPGD